MGNKINDPIARLMGLRYKSHPWHGLEVGDDAPEVVTAFIEMVPTDTVKYELDKVSGYIKIDRPQEVFECGTGSLWLYSAKLLRWFGRRICDAANAADRYSGRL